MDCVAVNSSSSRDVERQNGGAYHSHQSPATLQRGMSGGGGGGGVSGVAAGRGGESATTDTWNGDYASLFEQPTTHGTKDNNGDDDLVHFVWTRPGTLAAASKRDRSGMAGESSGQDSKAVANTKGASSHGASEGMDGPDLRSDSNPTASGSHVASSFAERTTGNDNHVLFQTAAPAANGKPGTWRKLMYSDGTVYEGYTLNGKRHGHGKFLDKSGNRYEGEWRDNLAHGYGFKVFRQDGGRHEGLYFKDKRHGWGIYLWETGDKFIGEVSTYEISSLFNVHE
jgi:hypothetical protein